MSLRVALEVARTQSEGPGTRYAVWVQGCPLRCRGCCNPHMLAFEGGTEVAPRDLAARILGTSGIEGVTLLGGEPFAQAAGLATMLQVVRSAGLSTMAFSGFTLSELRERDDARDLLEQLDIFVDGSYDESQPDGERRWIGSRNQVMHFLSERYDPDDAMFRAADTVEIRLENGVLTANGTPWGDALGRLRLRTLD